MARHGLNSLVHRRLLSTVFPHGIFVVNILGSALIGVIAGIIASERLHVSPEWRTFIVVGILGGFTTFSSFSLDTLTLFRSGHIGLGLWNVVGQVGLSLLATAIGFRLGLSH
jgi:CrcB protein